MTNLQERLLQLQPFCGSLECKTKTNLTRQL